MTWLETSIMARRGLAKGKPGKTYAITEESQGQYHYVYGPFAKPVLKVDPGSVISAETHDAFEGKIKHETDKPSEILKFPFLNPLVTQRDSVFAAKYCLRAAIVESSSSGPETGEPS
jgi:amidase